MRAMEGYESDGLPAGDPRKAVAIVLRNLIQILVERGVLGPEHLTRLALSSLCSCSQANESADPDLAAIDFIWSVFPQETSPEV